MEGLPSSDLLWFSGRAIRPMILCPKHLSGDMKAFKVFPRGGGWHDLHGALSGLPREGPPLYLPLSRWVGGLLSTHQALHTQLSVRRKGTAEEAPRDPA